MKHSTVVGGSTAKRVMNCPGSVALVQLAPPAPSSVYADKGTLLHTAITEYLAGEEVIGMTYEGQTLDQAMFDEKVQVALDLLDTIDPDNEMKFATETRVNFGKFLPGAFGSCDVLGRIGNTAYVIDWKFGDGIAVDAEQNEQLMYYAAAAMRTKEVAWVFDGADVIECVIIQPPVLRQWTTTPARIKAFEKELKQAVKVSAQPNAPLKAGTHCKFCPARPTCPQMTGAVERALKVKLDAVDDAMLGAYASNAVLLQGWIDSVNELVQTKIEKGYKIPGWKLVAKRGTRKWADEQEAVAFLSAQAVAPYESKVISPSVAEKLLKKDRPIVPKQEKNLPEGLTVSVSSGDTLAPESDPRPAVVQIGQQLVAALNKLN